MRCDFFFGLLGDEIGNFWKAGYGVCDVCLLESVNG